MVLKRAAAVTVLVALGSISLSAARAQSIFSGVGAGAGTALSAFEAAIGGPDNSTKVGPQNGGFRTINWDAVKLDGTDFGGNTVVIDLNHTIGIPVDRFKARGAIFEEVYAVSGDGFASVNPATAGEFPAFSPKNTFAMFNDNTIGQSFTFAGTNNPAGTLGFGAIFLDVEKANTSSIEYFSGSNSLGKFFVPAGASGNAEFLGVLFNSPSVTSVELTLGDGVLFSFSNNTVTPGGAENPPGGVDLAVVDDFVYAEPRLAVPEPSALAVFGAGGLALLAARLRRRR